jgi:hypothetical protein
MMMSPTDLTQGMGLDKLPPGGMPHVGAWNITSWGHEHVARVWEGGCEVLAVQETKLALV